jgi:hypothetical protein
MIHGVRTALARMISRRVPIAAIELFHAFNLSGRFVLRASLKASTILECPQSRESQYSVSYLADGDQWSIEVDWPDGTIERFGAFRAHLDAVHWIDTLSEVWLRERI